MGRFEAEHLSSKSMKLVLFVVLLQLCSILSKLAGNQRYLDVVDDVSIVAERVRDRPHYDAGSQGSDQQNDIDESLDLYEDKNERTVPASIGEKLYGIDADRVEDETSRHHNFLVRRIDTENVGTASFNSKPRKDDERVSTSEEETDDGMNADRVENEPSSHHDFLVKRINTKKVDTSSFDYKTKDDTSNPDSSKYTSEHLDAERVEDDQSSYHEFVSKHIESQKDDYVSLESRFQKIY